MNQTLQVDARFRGPEGMGNGGYVSGLVAEAIGGPAKVRLHAPTPIDKPITLVSDERGARLMDGETMLVEGEPLGKPLDLDPLPPPPSDEEIEQARVYFPTPEQHMASGCFVCGNKREEGDALCIHSGLHPKLGRAIDHWVPDATLADDDGLVATRFVWAALDCPSYFAFGKFERTALLAGLAAIIHRLPAPGERLTVTGWEIHQDDRKHHSASVIHDAEGQPIAMARALWVDVGPSGEG